jgi:hypothetical protein
MPSITWPNGANELSSTGPPSPVRPKRHFVTDGFLLLPWFPFGKTRILILQKASN